MSTYFAYRLPHKNEVHFLKGTLVKRESLTEMMGRGILICDFRSENIYQLEEIEEVSAEDWVYHYRDSPEETTAYEDYLTGFEKLQSEIKSGRFDKIVLTRTKKTPLKRNPMEIYKDLCKNYLNTFNYILSSPELGSWMGATPEKLCEIQDDTVTAISLAGTKNSEEKWTKKEIEEQLYVTHYIEQKLKELHCTNIKVDGPHNILAGEVIHLETTITAKLLSRESWRKVIEDLHPTPATCGIPALKSKEFIKDIEQHDRSIYTGFIGVFSEESKNCFVNLRCMELFPEEVVLYVGGGITDASNAKNEWQETIRKSKTLERFL